MYQLSVNLSLKIIFRENLRTVNTFWVNTGVSKFIYLNCQQCFGIKRKECE